VVSLTRGRGLVSGGFASWRRSPLSVPENAGVNHLLPLSRSPILAAAENRTRVDHQRILLCVSPQPLAAMFVAGRTGDKTDVLSLPFQALVFQRRDLMRGRCLAFRNHASGVR